MKTNNLMYVLVGAFMISSCSDNVEGVNGSNENQTGSTEYTASAGFDWATSRNVSVSVSSPKTTVVSIYSDKDCSEATLLVGDLLVSSTTTSLELNIPIHCETLYLKYNSVSGKKTMPIALNTNTRSEVVAAIVPEDCVQPTSEEDAGFRFYHNTGVAMFEDTWPNESGNDNDMNDVVFEYDLKVTECQKEDLLPAQGYKEGLLMTLDVRAKGGRYPTKLGVVLGGLDKKYIKETTVRIVLKGGQGTELELATGTDMAEVREVNGQAQYCKVTIDTKGDSPVVILDGLSDLGDNTNFFQVTPGYVEEGRPMLRAEVKLTGVNRSDAGVTKAESDAQLAAYRELITDTKKQNFFIVTHDNKEIHMKGYKPTYSYTNYDTDSKGLMMDNVPYCNKNGFVWGIKVPVGIAHASEKVLFSTAYPKFKEWVESDGAKNKDWYLHPAAGKVIRYW